MKAYLRLGEVKDKDQYKMLNNYSFNSETPKKIICYPIPPFVGEVKCDCGEPTKFMNKNMQYKCFKCLNLLIGKTKLQKTLDTSIPITKRTVMKIRFEWSVNGERWYSIYGSRFKPKHWNIFLMEIRELIINKNHIMLEVDYEKETKEMVIY